RPTAPACESRVTTSREARAAIDGGRSTVEILDAIEIFNAREECRDNLELADFLKEVVADVRRWRKRGRRATDELPTLEEFTEGIRRHHAGQHHTPMRTVDEGRWDRRITAASPPCHKTWVFDSYQ